MRKNHQTASAAFALGAPERVTEPVTARRFTPLFAHACLCVCVLISTHSHAEQAAEFPGLRALMDDQQFSRSGLNRLSPKERAALNRWLAGHATFDLAVIDVTLEQSTASQSTAPQSVPAQIASKQTAQQHTSSVPSTPPVAEPKKVVAKRINKKKRAAKETIKTRIAGKFTGWNGSSIFELENGQLWRQRQAGSYRYRAESPEVELFQNRFGLWEMRILATGKRVKVSRYKQ